MRDLTGLGLFLISRAKRSSLVEDEDEHRRSQDVDSTWGDSLLRCLEFVIPFAWSFHVFVVTGILFIESPGVIGDPRPFVEIYAIY